MYVFLLMCSFTLTPVIPQAMSTVDRADFVLKRSQAYDDSPQYAE